jgi:hypothetical protein
MLSSSHMRRQGDVQAVTRRFAIAWRNTERRRISPVAVLDFDGHKFRFEYLPTVSSVEDFRPFIGFPDLDRTYESERLWPFFALRVMDRRRPDFSRYVEWLGLPPDATPIDILSRSGGQRKGDAVQVIEQPSVDLAGATESVFLVRGARYATSEYSSTTAAEDLRAGDWLSIVSDTSNPTNPSALLITTGSEIPIGWIPDLLIGYVRIVMNNTMQLVVLRNNGPDAPWHLRLLVQLTGHAEPGYQAFIGPTWPPLGTATTDLPVRPRYTECGAPRCGR